MTRVKGLVNDVSPSMVNEDALHLLNRLKESSASLPGEALAHELGISRVALWKRVEALRHAGYAIAGGRKGYRLQPTDVILPWEFPGSEKDIHSFAVLGSTMDKALELALAGHPEGTLVHAERQSAGRGQAGRAWQTLEGNLSFTLLLKPALPLAYMGTLALEALCVLSETLEELYALKTSLKWPNDLVAGGRKVAGVLVETLGSAERPRWFTLGVGLNVRSVPDVDRPVGAVEALAGRKADRRDIVRLFRQRMTAWSREPHPTPARWFARHAPGGPWTVETTDGPVWHGTPHGFDRDGSLLLSRDATRRSPAPIPPVRFGTAKRIEGASS